MGNLLLLLLGQHLPPFAFVRPTRVCSCGLAHLPNWTILLAYLAPSFLPHQAQPRGLLLRARWQATSLGNPRAFPAPAPEPQPPARSCPSPMPRPPASHHVCPRFPLRVSPWAHTSRIAGAPQALAHSALKASSRRILFLPSPLPHGATATTLPSLLAPHPSPLPSSSAASAAGLGHVVVAHLATSPSLP